MAWFTNQLKILIFDCQFWGCSVHRLPVKKLAYKRKNVNLQENILEKILIFGLFAFLVLINSNSFLKCRLLRHCCMIAWLLPFLCLSEPWPISTKEWFLHVLALMDQTRQCWGFEKENELIYSFTFRTQLSHMLNAKSSLRRFFVCPGIRIWIDCV